MMSWKPVELSKFMQMSIDMDIIDILYLLRNMLAHPLSMVESSYKEVEDARRQYNEDKELFGS